MRLFSSRLDGSDARPLTDGSSVAWNACWSPDRRQVAFTGRDPHKTLHVFAMKADGSDLRQVTRFAPSEGQAQVPAWLPDGRRLAVQASARSQPGQIWIVDVATGAGRKPAPHEAPYLDEMPAWLPDGRGIAFQSNRTGRMEIWTMNADGSAPRQVTK